MGITVTTTGNTDKNEKLLRKIVGVNSKYGNFRKLYMPIFEKYGRLGVEYLSAATPRDTGKTASSWSYKITESGGSVTIYWTNSNVNKGVNIAMILQYGHGTGTGGYVQGIDYINPAMRKVFDRMAEDLWLEVIKA